MRGLSHTFHFFIFPFLFCYLGVADGMALGPDDHLIELLDVVLLLLHHPLGVSHHLLVLGLRLEIEVGRLKRLDEAAPWLLETNSSLALSLCHHTLARV